MTPLPDALADRVWQQTLLALRRRRRIRRVATGSTVALAVALLTLLAFPSHRAANPQPNASGPPTQPDSPRDSSLAILVIDPSGVRFEQRRPDEIADLDLLLDLSLDPVITIAMLE